MMYDTFGNELKIGDVVATNQGKYTYEFIHCEVLRFTKQMVIILPISRKSEFDPKYWEMRKFPEQLVKKIFYENCTRAYEV